MWRLSRRWPRAWATAPELADVGVLGGQGAGLLALLDKYFLDRTFNGVDLKADTAWLQRLAILD